MENLYAEGDIERFQVPGVTKKAAALVAYWLKCELEQTGPDLCDLGDHIRAIAAEMRGE